MHRVLIPAIALLLTLPLAAADAKEKSQPLRAITVDTHADTPSEYLEKAFDLGVVNERGHFDFPRMKAGGLDAEFFVAWIPPHYADEGGSAAYCLKAMETIHSIVEQNPKWVRFAASTSDMREAVRSGKRAILIGIEGGHAIEDSLDVLRAFYRLGARYMTLTHTNTNHWADSSGDVARNNGLSPFGRQVVREMNNLGMLIDVSHVSDKAFYDVIATSAAPVFASHSSARALADQPRNMTDDMLRALASNHGVVMVNFYPVFLSDEAAKAWMARERLLDELKTKLPAGSRQLDSARKEIIAAHPIPPVPYTRIVDHIDHMVKVAGIDHVGIGSDFDGISGTPVGMEDVSKLPALRKELVRRGYSENDIRKILGENFMRVFRDVEARAAELTRTVE